MKRGRRAACTCTHHNPPPQPSTAPPTAPPTLPPWVPPLDHSTSAGIAAWRALRWSSRAPFSSQRCYSVATTAASPIGGTPVYPCASCFTGPERVPSPFLLSPFRSACPSPCDPAPLTVTPWVPHHHPLHHSQGWFCTSAWQLSLHFHGCCSPLRSGLSSWATPSACSSHSLGNPLRGRGSAYPQCAHKSSRCLCTSFFGTCAR